MARPLRIEYAGAVYHITARGNERKKIYLSKCDYEKFIQNLADAKKKYNIVLHCYVLMGNHYHLIMETPEANLSKAMHYINGYYTTYFNIKRNMKMKRKVTEIEKNCIISRADPVRCLVKARAIRESSLRVKFTRV
jgi:REP element-mobilizing transposase RayT